MFDRGPLGCKYIDKYARCSPSLKETTDTMDRKRKLDVLGLGAEDDATGVNVTVTPPASQQALNPYTGRPYSAKYYDILSKRKGES